MKGAETPLKVTLSTLTKALPVRVTLVPAGPNFGV